MYMNIPNVLTIGRLIGAPVFFFVFRYGGKEGVIVAFIVYIILVISDALDGVIARKTKTITNFGKLADPLADKICLLSYLMAINEIDLIPGWMFLLIFYREFIVTLIRMLSLTKGKVIPAMVSGKIKKTVQVISIFTVLLLLILQKSYPFIAVNKISLYIIGFMTLITVISGIEYITKGIKVIEFK